MSGIREWEFGQFDSQAADFDADNWKGYRSILVYGNTQNQDTTNLGYNTSEVTVGYNSTADALHHTTLVEIALTQIKAKLGQIPVLVLVELRVFPYSSMDNWDLWAHRMYKGWDVGDTSNRYSDKSGLITWYEDVYSAYPGQDRTSVRDAETGYITVSADTEVALDVTAVVERALRDNTPIRLYLDAYSPTSGTTSISLRWKPTLSYLRPRLVAFYLYPLEFYESTSGGALDYASAIQEAEDGHYYLGAVEREQTGTPVRCWLRNYTEATQQVELLDDHPEWTTPVQRVGTGTGQLDYVTLGENATSQKYTVVFYSASQYEVKAEAYRDNSTSYHPQIDSNASWRGTVSGDWTSPLGGLTIPAAAWQSSGIATGDEFEIGTRGNTTDTGWPADSNDQVEITYDDNGSADATGWRPVVGHREKTTAAVTIDAASVFVPIRHVVAADWPIGNKVTLLDSVNADEGTVTSTQVRSLGTDTFTGSGLDDFAAPTGNYNGNANRTYRIQIDANGTPDTFSWSRDGSTSWVATGVSLSSTPVELEDGVWISGSATTGHTIGDYWTFDADTWGVTVGGLSVTSNSYGAGAILSSGLPIRDLTAATWTTVSQASGASQTPASRVYVDDTTKFANGDTVFLQQAGGSGDSETATITGTPTATYFDVTADLAYDYSAGAFVTKTGSGEESFWMRPVANSTTVEELKRFRLNARML